MFDDLLSKLIALLPEKLRDRIPERFRNQEEDEVTGEIAVDTGEITQVSDKSENVEADEDEDDDEDDDAEDEDDDEEDAEEAKKKKKSRIIKIIVIGALVWFALEEIPTNDSKKQEGKAKKAKSASKKKVKKTPKIVKQPKEDVVVSDIQPIEEKEIVPTPVSIPEPEVVATPDAMTTESTVIDSALIIPEQVIGEVSEKSAEEKVDEQISKFLGEDVADETEIVLEQPDYEKVGEGLVYNCKGRHWACIDRKNYFRCRELEVSVGSGQPDCAIAETYASIEDCQVMQIYKVNRAAPPEECKFTD